MLRWLPAKGCPLNSQPPKLLRGFSPAPLLASLWPAAPKPPAAHVPTKCSKRVSFKTAFGARFQFFHQKPTLVGRISILSSVVIRRQKSLLYDILIHIKWHPPNSISQLYAVPFALACTQHPFFSSRAAVLMPSRLALYFLLSSHTFTAWFLSCVWTLVANCIVI